MQAECTLRKCPIAKANGHPAAGPDRVPVPSEALLSWKLVSFYGIHDYTIPSNNSARAPYVAYTFRDPRPLGNPGGSLIPQPQGV